jgi:BolA protein
MDRENEIKHLLESKIKIDKLIFEDFSEQHSGHYQNPTPKHGASHVNLLIVSSDFENLSRIERTRLVYDSLGELLNSRGLHALTLKLLSPKESI